MASTKKKRSTAKPKQATTSAKKSANVPAVKPTAKVSDQVTVDRAVSSAKPPLFDLQQWNKWTAWIFALQGIAIVMLAASRLLPISTAYLTPNSLLSNAGTLVPATHHLFDISLGWLVAIFFFISAAAHAAIATVYRNHYSTEQQQGINRLRWLDYGLSSGVMLIVVALLCGVYDLMTLVAIFGFSLVASGMGLATEIYNQNKQQTSWLAFGFGCVANVTPWIIIAFYLFGANVYGTGHIPSYVYAVFGTMFVLMNGSKLIQYLHYQKKGKWANYLYNEHAYMILSVVTKTALAWQIFAGILHP